MEIKYYMKWIKWLWSVAFAFMVVLIYATLTSFFVTPYSEWYLALPKPTGTPGSAIISIGWTINYIVTIIVLAREIYSRKGVKNLVIAGVIGLFNVLWALFFFTLHLLTVSFIMQIVIFVLSVILWGGITNKDYKNSIIYFPALLWVGYSLIVGYNLTLFNI